MAGVYNIPSKKSAWNTTQKVLAIAMVGVLVTGGLFAFGVFNIQTDVDPNGPDGIPFTSDDSNIPSGVGGVDVDAIDPLGWGYASTADYIIASRVGTGGIVYYGAYNTTKANWVVAWTSTNKTAVLANVTNSAVVGSVVYAQNGIFGAKECSLIVGNCTEAFTAGKVAYQSSPNFYTVASASANSTVGYGYVWLIAINSAANANCLLMEEGIFTLGSWSLSAGLAWVSTTGTVTSTYPSATGNQLCSIGVMLNATTLQVQNPMGEYGEHV